MIVGLAHAAHRVMEVLNLLMTVKRLGVECLFADKITWS